ncbi:hypothetical protein AB0870_08275 [Microbacterium proteolyticum]|uniref:hypothetical protein n=1 Tax=Microbacterium proteolyticum TaxID=1572644 RepID=UPI00345BF423
MRIRVHTPPPPPAPPRRHQRQPRISAGHLVAISTLSAGSSLFISIVALIHALTR